MRVDDVGVDALAQRRGNRGQSVDDPAESVLLRHVDPIDRDASVLDLVGRRLGLRSRGNHRDHAPLVGEAMAEIVDMVLDATETRWVVDRGHQYFHRGTQFDRTRGRKLVRRGCRARGSRKHPLRHPWTGSRNERDLLGRNRALAHGRREKRKADFKGK